MITWKISWHSDRAGLNTAEILLSEVLFPPADAVSLIKDDAAKEEDVANWRLEAYFSEKPDVEALHVLFANHGLDFGPGNIEQVPDINWVAHSLEGLGIIEAGRFVLYGIHDVDRLPTDKNLISIRIDANLAFGTGHHPTTAGCLEILDRLDLAAPENVLDLGTGSAVLAIAAAKIWGCPIMATDIDQDSVEIAAKNTAYNEATGIEFLCAAGFDHKDIGARGPFDFIFANILAGPLQELASDMATHAKPGATLILAGLLTDQEDNIRAAYEQVGFTQITRLAHKTWPVLAFRRQA